MSTNVHVMSSVASRHVTSRNGMEWNGMEWNGTERNVRDLILNIMSCTLIGAIPIKHLPCHYTARLLRVIHLSPEATLTHLDEVIRPDGPLPVLS